jgi:hypothetical protein
MPRRELSKCGGGSHLVAAGRYRALIQGLAQPHWATTELANTAYNYRSRMQVHAKITAVNLICK